MTVNISCWDKYLSYLENLTICKLPDRISAVLNMSHVATVYQYLYFFYGLFILLQFLLHQAILQASCPRLHWLRSPPPLTGVEEDTLKIVLHFFYAECLPLEVSMESIQGCLKLASKTPGLEKLAKMCQEYLKKAALQERKDYLKFL